MCGPFSTMQNINLSKGPELRDRILKMQHEHAKVSAWIARIEDWQRHVNKGQWLGEQPDKCGSWKLRCMQPMQEANYNTLFDMCTEDLADPLSNKPYRKRTKLNHTSGILHHLMENYPQCPGDHEHEPIEGMTTRLTMALGKPSTAARLQDGTPNLSAKTSSTVLHKNLPLPTLLRVNV